MNQYLSDKIKIISLFSIVLVLYIHSGFHDYPHEILGMEFNHVLQTCISVEIGRCAVPIFYMISGYLFFLNRPRCIPDIFKKIKKRTRTLLVPYIIACIFYPLCLLIITSIPFTSKWINGTDEISNSYNLFFQDIIASLLYNKGAFQLWFLRHLIILVCLSPILFYLRRWIRHKEYLVYGLFLLALCNMGERTLVTSAFWFMAGDAFLTKLNKYDTRICLSLFIIISIIELYYGQNHQGLFKVMNIPISILGVVSIWNLYDKIVPSSFQLNNHKLIKIMTGYTFFIYLYHEPFLNIPRKLLVHVLGNSSCGFAISYLLSPWIFIALAIPCAMILKRYIPRIYKVLTGGR